MYHHFIGSLVSDPANCTQAELEKGDLETRRGEIHQDAQCLHGSLAGPSSRNQAISTVTCNQNQSASAFLGVRSEREL